ncbi:hypothetical protein PV08_04769 [Exophiala spinifera]|uniref:Uncharacterized protein n=1 Tax=Exophiala spinifera TaxID=91928 RepID=A0A0D2C1P4_9EURO|nr:uncharacterized protein PV08_04769 [Exophiala spinifera]KIW17574.1 hypothetical protein PV08_04769 [Exophiala spinifera]
MRVGKNAFAGKMVLGFEFNGLVRSPSEVQLSLRRRGMFHALIRTHHITSRKKAAALKTAAKTLQCFALLRSGGVPGVMYVQGHERAAVQKWVDTVHDLRYKDYQLVAPVKALAKCQDKPQNNDDSPAGTLVEVDSVKEMASQMEIRGLLRWWRVAMGFAHE